MAMPWLDVLKQLVEKNPIVILTFYDSEWESLRDSRRSINEFTIARPHALLDDVKVPTPCLIHGKSDDDEHLHFGLISSCGPVTTLESRIKVRRGVQIQPQTKSELLRLVTQEPHAKHLKSRLPVFYLKFVISNGGIITPLDHFEKYRRDPACRGPKKGLRVSYRSLSGRYLRQSAFLDLIRAGYIGAHAETTEHMKVLVDAVLQGGRSVVAAIQQPRTAD